MSSSVTTLNENFHLTNLNPPLSPQKQTHKNNNRDCGNIGLGSGLA